MYQNILFLGGKTSGPYKFEFGPIHMTFYISVIYLPTWKEERNDYAWELAFDQMSTWYLHCVNWLLVANILDNIHLKEYLKILPFIMILICPSKNGSSNPEKMPLEYPSLYGGHLLFSDLLGD